MTQLFSFKSAAMLCVATLAMCFAGQDANAQCRGGGYGGFSPGFGGTSININRGGVNFGYSSGYRGINYGYGGYGGGYGYGGINRGISINSYRPSYSRSAWHDTSHIDRYPGRLVPHGNHFDYVPSHSRVHRTGHWHH